MHALLCRAGLVAIAFLVGVSPLAARPAHKQSLAQYFGPFLAKARNPDTTAYRDLKKFKSFHIQDGDLVWGDYQMIFPIMDLYRGNILKGEETAPAHFVLSDAVSAAKTVLKKKTKAASTVSYRKTKALAQRTK